MALHVKHLPAEERRAITVETVVELAAEQNPNDITTAAIAKRMGLTQGALFRHFPSKNAIMSAVMEWVASACCHGWTRPCSHRVPHCGAGGDVHGACGVCSGTPGRSPHAIW